MVYSRSGEQIRRVLVEKPDCYHVEVFHSNLQLFFFVLSDIVLRAAFRLQPQAGLSIGHDS